MPNPPEAEFLSGIELHSLESIKKALDEGLDPRSPIQGRTPLTWLTEMYTRSPRFPACVRLLLDRGAALEDPALAPVLLDDAEALKAAVLAKPSLLKHRTTLKSAFTPLVGASLLHVAAEYGNLNAARALIEMGADVDARAAVDEHGLNGHTPLFHTVNSNRNHAQPVLRLLLDAAADPTVRLPGITWGRGFEWETTCFDVTPVSYAQMGLLPQVHRDESQIFENVRLLLKAARRPVPPLENIPNRYLQESDYQWPPVRPS